MIKTLVVYESKYGFTREIARDCSLVLGNSFCSHVDKLKKSVANYDIIAICTPVYNDLIPHSIMDFVTKNAELLKSKRVVLLCCCLEVDFGKKHLKPIRNLLGDAVVWQEIIGTKMDINHLETNDYEDLKKICEKDEISFKDNNLFLRERFLQRLTKLKKIIGESKVILDREVGMRLAEKYLSNLRLCTLGTGYLQDVEANLMEYFYRDGYIFFLSEGGEKLYYILQNPKVSIAVYKEFSGKEDIAGLQIQGRAAILDIEAEEYINILTEKECRDYRSEDSLVSLYVIKVSIEKIEFIFKGEKRFNYNIKQVYNY